MRIFLWRAFLTLLIAAIAGAGAWALWPKPVLVDTETIARGPLEVTVEDEGITRIREVYTVSAPTAGKMLRAPREVGDEVIADQTVVAVIEPTDPVFLDIRTQRVNEAAVDAAAAAVELAAAQVKQAKSQLEFAQGDLRRANQLAQRQTISERTLDKARLDVATGEAGLASAIANLEVHRRELVSARARLMQPGEGAPDHANCCIHLRSPVDGRVLKVVAESEQVVQAGAPLIEIGDPADLEIVVDLLSRDAVRVEPGAPARIEGWGGKVAINARVKRVEPTGFTKISALGIEEQRVKTVLDFTDPLESWRRLGHGYRIVARITVWRGENLVLVPLSALFRQGNKWAVFMGEGGRARTRIVDVGERDRRAARVISGLQEGEQVILHPSDRLRDGIAATPRD
jgi:HlyD family secretion protein